MKKNDNIILSLFVTVALMIFYPASYANSQNVNGFSIQGRLKGLPDGTKLFLIRNKDNDADTLMTTVSNNERFIFCGNLPISAEAYFIKINQIDSIRKDPLTRDSYITLMVENRPMSISGDINDLSLKGITVEGSDMHAEFKQLKEGELPYYTSANYKLRALDSLFKTNNPSIAGLNFQKEYEKVMESFQASVTNFYENWITNHLNSYLTPWVIQSQGDKDRVEWMALYYRKLTASSQNSQYGQKLKETIEAYKRSKESGVAPEFNYPAPDGKLVSLTQVASTGKFTIIDFWASWCKPCRAEFPAMKNLYEQYNKKGLVILGYSIDKNEADWKKALEKENLPWINVRETTDFALKAYGVTMIPWTYIVDQQGKIVSQGLRGEQLEQKIAELLRQ